MDKQEKGLKKQQKLKEKERIRHHKKIERGLDLCLIAACFLAFLTAALMRAFEEMRNRNK